MSELEGKVALVTGGTSGIGSATVLSLAEAGARVIFSGRSTERGEALLAHPQGAGLEVRFVPADLRREQEVAVLVARAAEAFEGLDIVVNCGGINVPEEADGPQVDAWDQLFEVNVRGTWLCCRAVMPHLIRSRGCIVNLGSVSGTVGVAGKPGYAASKAAVISLSKSLALSYADRGVRVNVVCPGPVDTPMTRGPWPSPSQVVAGMRRAAAMSPMKRVGAEREVASVIRFLVGPGASYITGASIMVDGGKSAGMMPEDRYADVQLP